ncbi:hypothetical protein ACMFMF_009009 [Clarireedia jacksonii]
MGDMSGVGSSKFSLFFLVKRLRNPEPSDMLAHSPHPLIDNSADVFYMISPLNARRLSSFKYPAERPVIEHIIFSQAGWEGTMDGIAELLWNLKLIKTITILRPQETGLAGPDTPATVEEIIGEFPEMRNHKLVMEIEAQKLTPEDLGMDQAKVDEITSHIRGTPGYSEFQWPEMRCAYLTAVPPSPLCELADTSTDHGSQPTNVTAPISDAVTVYKGEDVSGNNASVPPIDRVFEMDAETGSITTGPQTSGRSPEFGSHPLASHPVQRDILDSDEIGRPFILTHDDPASIFSTASDVEMPRPDISELYTGGENASELWANKVTTENRLSSMLAEVEVGPDCVREFEEELGDTIELGRALRLLEHGDISGHDDDYDYDSPDSIS